MCIGLLVLGFSRPFWTGCIPAAILVCSAWWRRMDSAASSPRCAAQRFGWWCGRGRGPQFAVFVLRYWADSAPILPRGYDSRENSGCCWSKFMFCVSAWESACSGRGFCKLSGKWVRCQARGVPHIWSPTVAALTPADCCVCIWEPWPVLNDGVCGEPLEGRGDLELDGVSSGIAKSHHYERPLHARPRGCAGENCWGLAISGIILDKDWP